MRWIVIGASFALAFSFGVITAKRVREKQHPIIRALPVGTRIEWQVPIGENHSCIVRGSQGLDAGLPLGERIAAGIRVWIADRDRAHFVHVWCRAHFDRAESAGLLVEQAGQLCYIRVDDPESIDDQWDFLVRQGGLQSQYRVTAIAGNFVRGSLRAQRRIQPVPDSARGVLLLRPTYQRPQPQAQRHSPLLFAQQLSEQMKDMAFATNQGELRYPMDPPWSPFGGGQLGANGSITEVAHLADGGISVILSVGGDDDVARGDEYRLSRSSYFVGFARVIKVFPNRAIARFDTVHTGSGAPPLKGDRCYVR